MLQGLVRCYACIKVPEKSRFSDSCGSRSMNLPYKSPGRGTPHTKWVGMLLVSLRGVNFRFCSHLGCSGQNAIIFSSEGLV